VAEMIKEKINILCSPPIKLDEQHKIFYLRNVEVVNHSFSVELYLKSLMILLKKEYHTGHDLESLFKKLPLDSQESILEYYKSNFILYRRNMRTHGMEKPDLMQLLREAKNTFVDYRYQFESSNNHPYELSHFAFCVRNEILKHKPELDFVWNSNKK
jgi:hypothetical protein